MAIYKPTELLAFLEELGIAPKKALSQNFLIDRNILQKIATTARVSPGDLIVEVGPGPGSLTEELLLRKANLIAVEKDDILAKALQRLKTHDNHLQIFNDDILKFPMEDVLKPKVENSSKAKVIANLPYHLTTPIIVQLITQRHLFSHLIIMVQDEVARRFTAPPGSGVYGSFTVFLNFYCNPHYAFTVSNQCFYPVPKVNSAIVVLELKEPPQVSNVDQFFQLTRTAFHQRRKMMRSSLRELYTPEDIQKSLTVVGKNPLARPEELSLNDFLKLFELLQK